MLLHGGVVVNKWDDSDVPDFSKYSIDKWDERESKEKNNRSKLLVILSLFIITLGLLKYYDSKQNIGNN